jgi:hypothetical protein
VVNKTTLLKYSKYIRLCPEFKTLYELVDLLGKRIKGQFYAELSLVIVTKNTVYPIVKILRNSVRKGNIQFLVKWRGYPSQFNSCIPAKAVKNMASENEPTHFYDILLSNASHKLFPSNTLSSFKVQLTRPVDLGSKSRCEVGV